MTARCLFTAAVCNARLAMSLPGTALVLGYDLPDRLLRINS